MIRVAFIDSGGGSWTGGPNYMKNLLHAVVTAGGDIVPVLIVPPDMPDTALADFPDIEVIRTNVVNPNLRWKARKAAQRIVGFDPIMEILLAPQRHCSPLPFWPSGRARSHTRPLDGFRTSSTAECPNSSSRMNLRSPGRWSWPPL